MMPRGPESRLLPAAKASAEPHHHACDGCDAAGDDGSDGGDEDVAVLDVGEFVGDDAFEFAAVHHGHEAGGDADDAVGGVCVRWRRHWGLARGRSIGGAWGGWRVGRGVGRFRIVRGLVPVRRVGHGRRRGRFCR